MFFKFFSQKKLLLLGILIVSLSLTILLGSLSNQSNSRPIVIGISNNPSWWPWFIAEHQGYFAKNEINAEFKFYDNYSDSVRDFKLGYLDANSEINIGKLSSGKALVLNSISSGEDQLIAKPWIKGLEDLRGKTIVSESEEILDLYFNHNTDEIDICIVEAGLASSAFVKNNKIDAVASYPPYSDVALSSKGSHVIASSKDFPLPLVRILAMNENLNKISPGIVEKIRASWFAALDYINNNPKKSKKIIASKLNLDIDQVQIAQAQTTLLSKFENEVFFIKSSNHDKKSNRKR